MSVETTDFKEKIYKFRLWDNRNGNPVKYFTSEQEAYDWIRECMQVVNAGENRFYTQDDISNGRCASLVLEEINNN